MIKPLILCFCAIALGLSETKAEDITKFSTISTHAPATLARIVVSNPQFFFKKIALQKYGGLEQPTMSFTVANNSRYAVSRLYLKGALQSPGRAVPWISHEIVYDVPGGLKPGESRSFSQDAELLADWSEVSKKVAAELRFTLRLTAIDDAKGDRIDE